MTCSIWKLNAVEIELFVRGKREFQMSEDEISIVLISSWYYGLRFALKRTDLKY
jgi:hypothetical protein